MTEDDADAVRMKMIDAVFDTGVLLSLNDVNKIIDAILGALKESSGGTAFEIQITEEMTEAADRVLQKFWSDGGPSECSTDKMVIEAFRAMAMLSPQLQEGAEREAI